MLSTSQKKADEKVVNANILTVRNSLWTVTLGSFQNSLALLGRGHNSKV